MALCCMQVLARGRSAHVAHTLKSALMEDVTRAKHARPMRNVSPQSLAPSTALVTNQVWILGFRSSSTLCNNASSCVDRAASIMM